LLVYDVTRPESFESIQAWFSKYQEYIPKRPSSVIILIGNKCDLNHERMISAQVGEAFAKEHGFVFLETVANTVPGLQKFEDVLVQKFQNSMRCFEELQNHVPLRMIEDAAGREAERQVSGGCMRAHAHARDAAAPRCFL
jgi:GTPase SAR1 family protein